MATNTEKFKLIKPGQEEFYDVGVSNANMDTIDGVLKTLQDAIDSGASEEELKLLREQLTAHLAEKASLGKAGHVQLSSATDSTDETKAATPKAVKSAHDLVNEHIAESAKYAQYHRNIVNQTISNDVGTSIVFTHKEVASTSEDLTELDVSGKIKILEEGTYLVILRSLFSTNSNGYRSMTMVYNGDGITSDIQQPTSIDTTTLQISKIVKCYPNDLVGMSVRQTSGGSLDFFGGVNESFIQIHKLG